MDNGFTHLDEADMILEQPWVQDWSWDSIRRMFTASWQYTYSPLAFLAWALQKRWFDLDPGWLHTVTLGLHLTTTLLVGLWIAALTDDRRLALAAGLVFGLHPLQVESVAWATGQRTVLSGLLFFAALAAQTWADRRSLIRPVEGPNPPVSRGCLGQFRNPACFLQWLSLLCLIGAILAKGTAFVFPVIVLLQRLFLYRTSFLDHKPSPASTLIATTFLPTGETETTAAPPRAPGAVDEPGRTEPPADRPAQLPHPAHASRPDRTADAPPAPAPRPGWRELARRWADLGVDLAWAAVISLIGAGVAWLAAAPQMPAVPTLERVLVAARGVLFQLGSFVWPVGLSCLYPIPEGPADTFPWSYWLAPALVAGLAWCAWQTRQRDPLFTFGAMFFAVALAPLSQLVRVGMPILTSDHFMYVPLAGLALAAASIYLTMPGPSARSAWLAGMVLLSLGLGLLTYRQCEVWQSAHTLFGHTLQLYPGLSLAHHQLGVALLREERWDEAVVQFDAVLQSRPDDLDARIGRATARVGARDWAAARAELAQILARAPDHPAVRALARVLPSSP
ncbi:MAG: Tetratricopeptide TPR_2 repeat protein [Candidatus Ozemobacter sibiricus]|uniref:Tetratricopeptide TPR_2 repeat protein n=1 Tax=Candidatus Ozemobacter sibiricus TaxID=2268124 RepID=A0A367ZTN1_9BACT|nr:MAG: Tetratricopeptide TPR_2 repeat protein [Candidatus Ozemobacter sibiricus]